MTSSVLSVPCIQCGTEVILKSQPGNSQAVPAGDCPKCGLSHYVSYPMDGGMQVNAYSGNFVRRQNDQHALRC